MKQRAILALLIFIVVASTAIIVAQSMQEALPPLAQRLLDRYVSTENAAAVQPVVVRQVVHASRPEQFTAAFLSASVGESLYFGNTRAFRSAATPNSVNAATSPVPGSGVNGARDGRAIPFPPLDLWCVLLNQEGGNGRVIFLARHQDLYNSDWIVHEAVGSPGDAGLAARLTQLGCVLH